MQCIIIYHYCNSFHDITQIRLASLCTTHDLLQRAETNITSLATVPNLHLSFTDAWGGYSAILLPASEAEGSGDEFHCREEFSAETFDPRRSKVSIIVMLVFFAIHDFDIGTDH